VSVPSQPNYTDGELSRRCGSASPSITLTYRLLFSVCLTIRHRISHRSHVVDVDAGKWIFQPRLEAERRVPTSSAFVHSCSEVMTAEDERCVVAVIWRYMNNGTRPSVAFWCYL